VDVGEDADAHGSRATLARVAVGIALAAVWTAAALVLLRTEVPDDLTLPDLDPRAYFTAAFLERADHVRTVTRALFVGSTLVQLAVGGLMVWQARGTARALRLRGRYRTGLGLGVAVLAAVWAATLPFGAVRHWWGRRYGLSHQAYAAWLWDSLLGLAVRAVLVSLAVAGVLWLAGRFGRRWWIAAAPALAALAVVVILVQPLVIQPLFNRFEPLPDRALAAEVERIAAREGVAVDRVDVADASRRTTTANAYVAGIGPTKRVVFYDTALDGRFSRAELLSLAAHEVAHVARSHLWKGIVWFVLLAVPGLAVVALVAAACASDEEPPADDGGGGTAAADTGLLGEVQSEGVLTVSTDPAYPPQSSLNEETGEYEGFDIDVATEIANRLGVEISWETPAWDVITAGGWNDRWDVSVGSMTVTAERAEVLDFTTPYYYTPAGLAVQAGSDIASLDDLSGKRVGVCGACTYEFYLRQDLNIDIPGFTFEYLVPADIEIVTYDTDSTAIQDLEIGRIDAAMSAVPTLQGAIDKGRDIQLLGDPVFSEPLAAALDKSSSLDSTSLTEEISGIIQEMHDDGTLTELSEKWYGEDITQNPTG